MACPFDKTRDSVSRCILALLVCVATLLLHMNSLAATTTEVPQTGQTVSYLAGDDGNLQYGIQWPTPRFKDNGNGTISDKLTGIIWLKHGVCFVDNIWSTAVENGKSLQSGVCGLSDGSSQGDWRLANIRELVSLLHMGVFNPAVPNTTGTGSATSGNPFNNLQGAEYWSSTSVAQSPANAFAVNFLYGHMVSKSKSSPKYALYVHTGDSLNGTIQLPATGQDNCFDQDGVAIDCTGSGQDGESQAGKAWPEPRFTDQGDGTVLDNLTNLFWLKNGNCFGISGWSGAVTFSNTLSSGSCGLTDGSLPGDWHLPNRKELESLLDYDTSNPALSDTAGTGVWSSGDPFTNVQTTSGYWTSTTYAAFTSHSWFINMGNGISGTEAKQNVAYFWPVRGIKMENLEVEITGSQTAQVTSSPSGISCPGVCSYDFPRDSSVVLTAHPPLGTRLQSWSGTGCGSSLNCTVTMDKSLKVTADFGKGTNSVAQWLLLLIK